MAVQIENLEGLERKLILPLSWDEINNQVTTRLKNTQKRARVDGFRPGKAPLKMIESMYGASAQQEVINDTALNTFYQVITAENIKVAGLRKLEAEQHQDDEKVFKIAAIFEVFPEIEIGDLSSQEIEQVSVDVTETDIDKTIEILRKQRTRYDYVEREAQNGDRVIIDFAGKIGEDAFEGGSSENYPFVLGNGQMLPEFEAGILGMKEGEVKDITVNFPEEYHGKEVAGKTAIFTITLKNVSEAKLPEIDDAFARSLGIEDGDSNKMREEVKKNISREAKRRTEEMTKENVMQALLSVTAFDAPQSLVDDEIKRLREEAQQNFINQGWDKDKLPDLPDEMFTEQAQKRVKLGLILAKIVEDNKLEATEEQIRNTVTEFAESYEDPEDVIQWYMSDKKNLQGPTSLVIEANVVKYVLESAKTQNKTLSFDEVMGGQFAA